MALDQKLRVLFVDDEPAILRGLRSVLHRDRAVWDMSFANSASEALTLMDQGPFDVVITDMRMPEMDGAQLLSVVQQKWPATCRIVLSGQADRDSLLRVMPTMHSFLSKPCKSDDLRAAVKRCTSILSITTDPTLRSLIGRVDKLPSPPATFMRLTKVAQDPRSRLDDIAAVVAQDSAFAMKVMQIASSAAFGEGAQSTSLHRCVGYLGIELLKALALSENLYAAYRGPSLPISLETLQAHALRTATLARAFIKDDLAFACGLLHDVGRVVLQLGLPSEYGQMLEELRVTGETLVAAEKRVFGADHAAVGGCLMRMWSLPDPLIEAVEHHHEPARASDATADVIAVVRVAETLADNSDSTELDLEFLRRANLIDQLPQWRAIAASLAA
ncbi:MAG: response regulator [Kofleriaceae bacterium]